MTGQTDPPVALLVAAQSGNRRARESLVREWLPTVLGWCVRLGGPRINPEDTAQDVFMIVLDNLHRVFSPEQFPSWLFSVTRKVIARNRRRAWVNRWAPGVEIERADDAPSPERRVEARELQRRVQAALERLPARHREVLVLCDLEQRSASEVAELLDLPPGTVKSRLRVARQRFRASARRAGLAEGSE